MGQPTAIEKEENSGLETMWRLSQIKVNNFSRYVSASTYRGFMS